MPKILLVEDDQRLAERLSQYLERHQFVVDVAANVADANQILKMFVFDTLILDWELPDGAGVDVLAQYRAQGGSAPALFLTGKTSIDYKHAGFLAGADDYLTKPFDELELLLRLQALARRAATPMGNVLTVGNATLNTSSCELRVSDRTVNLRPKEYLMMELFMKNPGCLYSTDELRNKVWKSEEPPTDQAVRQWVYRVRTVLDESKPDFEIRSIPGLGYKLVLRDRTAEDSKGTS